MTSNINDKLVEHLTASNHKFMVNLYRVLATNDESVFFSPFSIYVALVLAYLGSNGETAAELQEHLDLPQERENLLKGMRLLLNNLKHPELNTATEMFVQQTYKVRASYKDSKKFMNSEPQLVDFVTAADQATRLINSWVSSQTNNKINNLIPDGTLDETTRLVLVNAIHFKDKWLMKFDQINTRKRNFFISKNIFKKVDMMYLTELLGYKEEDTFKVLELPYQNINFKLIIFLPNDIDGLPSLEQKLPELNLGNILKGMGENKVPVRVFLPKFELEKFFDLNAALQKLGINAMFDESEADFTGIHEPSESRLVVSKVLHKTFVGVNEEGTEAAAATGLILRPCCVRTYMGPIYDFVANHPFIYFILCNETTLFIGKHIV